MFEAASSTEVHLRIRQENLWNFTAESSQKGFFFKYRNAQKLSPNKDHVTLECQRQFCSHNIVKTSLNKLFWQWAYTTN
jgi:hypothetical protein